MTSVLWTFLEKIYTHTQTHTHIHIFYQLHNSCIALINFYVIKNVLICINTNVLIKAQKCAFWHFHF